MRYFSILTGVVLLIILPTGAAFALGTEPPETVSRLNQEIRDLKKQLREQRTIFDQRIKQLEAAVKTMKTEKETAKGEAGPDGLQETLRKIRGEDQKLSVNLAGSGSSGPTPAICSLFQSFNPEISVIVDTFYHNDDSDEGITHLKEEAAGFGHNHSHDSHHAHAHLEDGLNLRHVELQLSAEVDPYFRGWAIAAISEDSSELEEAVIQTSCLPAGLQLQAGKFRSGFGRLNARHSHEWDFVDQPLIYELSLGDHGLNDKGIQLSWLAPLPAIVGGEGSLLVGLEAFQGENEKMFQHLGGENLPDKDGPRLGVGWLKFAPELPARHGLQFGLFAARGVHQESHDGNSDGIYDHWFDGHSTFWGADLVYKYDATSQYGVGDLTLQGEYFGRRKDLKVVRHDLMPIFSGDDRIDRQDGYYLQAVYGILPRWRTGLRWEQAGLTSETELPGSAEADYDSSWRLSGMLDFTPSEFSRLRLQLNRGEYELKDGREDVWQFFLQWMISLGTHGAHKF